MNENKLAKPRSDDELVSKKLILDCKRKLAGAMVSDRFQLSRKLDGILKEFNKLGESEALQSKFQRTQAILETSLDKAKSRKNNLPKVTYPDLPVSQRRYRFDETNCQHR
ncbi:MAG: hypothetical protein KUG73_12095 [Pseudomonadales bacterium]|nr:hypothetical protein [Pseudomonadales bacterium]